MLVHLPKVLDREQVAAMSARLAQAEWVDGRQTVGPQGAQVKRNLQLAENSPLRKELAKQLLETLARDRLFFAAVLPLRTLPPRFNRYEGGGTYGRHVDGSVLAMPTRPGEPAAHLRSDVSCTLFLSDPDEYDGGSLIIDDTYGAHGVKLPAGDMIVYPSSSLHRVEPVTRGARMAAFFWVQSMVREPARRQLLFDLDTSIQALTKQKADDAVLTRLTSIYHNLLRDWAEI